MRPSTFSFASLNLSGIETERPAGAKVDLGPQVLTITEAKLRAMTSGNGHQLEVKLEDDKGAYVRDFITVRHTNSDTQKYGLQRLKALLTFAGHPNPEEPGDVATLINRQVGVHIVEEEREITDSQTGQPKKIKVHAAKKFGAYFSPDGNNHVPSSKGGGGGATDDLNDQIPF